MASLRSLRDGYSALIVGASGAIGHGFAVALANDPRCNRLVTTARGAITTGEGHRTLDLENEDDIAALASALRRDDTPLDLVIVATGMLHDGADVMPEKRWREIDPGTLERLFRINTIGPAMLAKHLLPCLARDRKAVFAALSARVGSIGDNELGGWYGYRASKAALNMILSCAAIELARSWPHAVCIGLHPGTVESPLSEPFLRSGKRHIFQPDDATRRLLAVVDRLQPSDSGRVFAWDGTSVPP
ncbi:MAG: SDR family oxidoreductase [Rhodospirillales bacterium]|nr:SDR family oxidoreductase [Rhodospirillales bacterium]